MKRNARNSLSLTLILSLVLILIGIIIFLVYAKQMNDKQPVATATPLPTVSPSPTATPVLPADQQVTLKNKGPYLAPLTGIGQSDELVVGKRPIGIMINNHYKAVPQSGLQHADVVYEILAEGEITRFLAIFQSESSDLIGPVRSVRTYYMRLADAIDAILVHAGGSQEALNLIAQEKMNHIDDISGGGASFWRSSDRQAPHNLYTSTDKIQVSIDRLRYPMTWDTKGYRFAEQDLTTGESHTSGTIEIPYLMGYSVSYVYEETTKRYLRLMDGKPHLDRESNENLTVANVLVIESKHEIIDDIGHRKIDFTGPGNGYLFQQGKWQAVTWKLQDGLIRAYVNDQEVEMMRGNTWIQVIPTGKLAQVIK